MYSNGHENIRQNKKNRKKRTNGEVNKRKENNRKETRGEK